MIKSCDSLLLAQKVIQTVNNIMKSKEYNYCWVECFDNCREQGLVIKCYNNNKEFNIAIAQQRNSNDIVIYCYNETQFPSNLPKEDQWNGVFFHNEYLITAAEYIIKNLKAFFEK